MSKRLTAAQVKAWREKRRLDQLSRCALCRELVSELEAVADHCHKSGRLRGVLHRGCNAMLGSIENNMPRHKLTDIRRLTALLRAVPAYLWANYDHEPLHHTHRTPDERREKRNAKARKTRAAKKDSSL